MFSVKCVTHEKLFGYLDELHMNIPIVPIYLAEKTYATLF